MKKRTLFMRLACMLLLLTLLTGCAGAAPRPTAEEYIVGKWLPAGIYTVNESFEPIRDPMFSFNTWDGVVSVSGGLDQYTFTSEKKAWYTNALYGNIKADWDLGDPNTGAHSWSNDNGKTEYYVYSLSGGLSGVIYEGLYGLPGGIKYFKNNNVASIDYDIVKDSSFITTVQMIQGRIIFNYYIKDEAA